ncbi:MAG TPA: hypothetical protein VKR31_05925 [Rhizomicrobium sp.]|nr:hypothetical protein [Rhizomicrobium sp.]
MAVLDRIVTIALLALYVDGSAYLIVRRALMPKDSPELRRPSRIDLLPAPSRGFRAEIVIHGGPPGCAPPRIVV